MSHNIKFSVQQQIQSFKSAILQLPEFPLSDILSSNTLQEIIDGSAHKRNRIFTPLVTLRVFISQVLSTNGSCRQAVSHVMSERISQGKKANSMGTSSYCKARETLPLDP